MAIAVDSSTIAATKTAGILGATIASGSFTPPSASLVVMGVTGGATTLSGQQAVASVSDGTVSYTLLTDQHFVGDVFAAVYGHYYVASPGAITVTATWASGSTPQQGAEIVPVVLTGANSTQNGATGVAVSGCGTTNTSTTVTCATAGTAPAIVGAGVTGAGVPADNYITAVSAGVSFTLNAAATATATVSLTVGGTQAGSGLTPSCTVAATAAGSVIFAAVSNFTSSTVPTVPGGQTTTFNGNASPFGTSGNGYWSQITTSPTSGPGNVTINATAPTGLTMAMAAVEILAAPAGAAITGFIPQRMPLGA